MEKPIVYIVPHSHYDAIWIFNKKDNLEINCNYILKKAIEILKKEKDFKFIIEQTYLLEYIEHNYPELFKDIKNFVIKDRIEISSGEYLMADTMIPSGETIIREIIEGKTYVMEKFDKDVKVFWGADSFGYNAQMPQILSESGYRYFAFRRGITDPIKAEFYWKGLDGTTILTHWLPLGYRAGFELSILHQTFLQLKNQVSTKHILMPSGSGSTPPQPEICETVRKYNESSETIQSDDYPYMRISTLSEFFAALDKEIKEKNISIPTKRGELYSGKASKIFPDVASTRAWIKQNFKEYETCLLMFERWNTILRIISNDTGYSDDLKKYWKQIMFFAMHDAITGTGIDPIYDEMREVFNKMDNTLRKSLLDCLKKISNVLSDLKTGSHQIIVFNSVSWEIDEWIEVDVIFAIDEAYEISGLKSKDDEFIDIDILDCELHEKDRGIKTAKIGFMAKIPSTGFVKYELLFNNNKEYKPEFSGLSILSQSTSHETKFTFEDYTLEINAETGIFTISKDKKLFLIGNNLRIEEELGDLYYHRDTTNIIKSESGEGIFFGAFKKEKYYVLSGKIRTKIIYQSKYYAIRWPYRLTEKIPPVLYEHGFITIRKEISIYKGNSRIDCVTYIDNNHPHIRLRMEFDVPFKGYTYMSGTQFGAICRPTNLFYLSKAPEISKKWKEIPNGSFPSMEWIDYSSPKQNIGLTLAHFGLPSHEIRDNRIYLTLLRGVQTLAADGDTGPYIPTPDAAEKKEYTFKYSIIPHTGNWQNTASYRHGIQFNMKPIAFQIIKDKNNNNNNSYYSHGLKTNIKCNNTDMQSRFSFLKVEPKNVIVSTIKLPQQTEEGSVKNRTIVVRLYETEGISTITKLQFYFPIKAVVCLNLLEQVKRDCDNEIQGIEISGINKNEISLYLGAFKIITLKIEFDI